MSSHGEATLPPIALTMGEPAGIGPDVTLAAWMRRRELDLPRFYCLADPALLAERAATLGIDCPMAVCSPADATCQFDSHLPVVPLEAVVKAEAGRPTPTNAQAVIEAIARAVGDVRSGAAAALVTNPISKKTLYAAGFQHPGHTEFLGTLSAAWTGTVAQPVMMMAGPQVRTVPVTIHIPLRQVADRLTTDLIIKTGLIVADALKRRFAIERPRLAVAGLNPHGGEQGAIGDEDETIVRPAVAALSQQGIDVRGPLPADTMFHPAALDTHDAALCMYHDQALIPAKTLSFAETVNVTLGLAFVRTSPDHGTAFDIAGTGQASPSSLAAALRLAAHLRRNELAA
jgi:4-hydroxythreonine-4-phosphate dehydrogenase